MEQLTYHYNSTSDLQSALDSSANAPTYTYLTDHGLETITDPLGRRLLRNFYDDENRLIAQEDEAGNRTHFNHDLGANASMVTDRLGRMTTVQYDARGNVTTKIDANGQTWISSYDADDNLLRQTNPLGPRLAEH